MRLPEHYKCPGYVLRLIRSLHGTKQAAFLWSQCLRTHLESHGFKRLISDGSVYVKEWTTEVIPGTQSEAQEPQEKPKSGEPVSGSGSQSHQSNSTHDDPDDYRGITKLFSIKSQLQKLVALSTSETETIALCEQIKDAALFAGARLTRATSPRVVENRRTPAFFLAIPVTLPPGSRIPGALSVAWRCPRRSERNALRGTRRSRT